MFRLQAPVKTVRRFALPRSIRNAAASVLGAVLAAGCLALLTQGCRVVPWLGAAVYGLFTLLALAGPAPHRRRSVRIYTACQIAVLAAFVALQALFDGHPVPVWQTFILALVLLDIGPDLLSAARRREVAVLAGVVLVVTLPGPWSLHASPEGVRYEAPLAWILLYTLWSGAAACSHTPRLVVLSLAVLAVPLLLTGRALTLWGQSRAITLAVTALTLVHWPRLEAALSLPPCGQLIGLLRVILRGAALAMAACRLSLWLAGR